MKYKIFGAFPGLTPDYVSEAISPSTICMQSVILKPYLAGHLYEARLLIKAFHVSNAFQDVSTEVAPSGSLGEVLLIDGPL